MARAGRLERLDAARVELEAEYLAALMVALQKAAAGSWGLFDHNGRDRAARAKFAPVVAQLCELGEEINGLRRRLELEPFALHAEFLAARGPVASSAPGEPKRASAWLENLGKAGD